MKIMIIQDQDKDIVEHMVNEANELHKIQYTQTHVTVINKKLTYTIIVFYT